MVVLHPKGGLCHIGGCRRIIMENAFSQLSSQIAECLCPCRVQKYLQSLCFILYGFVLFYWGERGVIVGAGGLPEFSACFAPLMPGSPVCQFLYIMIRFFNWIPHELWTYIFLMGLKPLPPPQQQQ